MNKEKKIFTVQVRITPSEKQMIKKINEHDSEITASRLFRKSIYDYYEKLDLNDGVGSFEIG